MLKQILKYYHCYLSVIMLLFVCSAAMAGNGDDIIVSMPKSKGTVYQLLEVVSKQTGKMFIYDSNIIPNDKKTKIAKGKYTLTQLVRHIVGNERLEVRTIGNHILVTVASEHHSELPHLIPDRHKGHIVIEGTLVDDFTHKPLEAGSVRVEGSSIGSVTNTSGDYRLVLPDSLRQSFISFSHVGYNVRVIEVEALEEHHSTVGLREHIFPLQEVVLRLSNPLHLLEKMQQHIRLNYVYSPIRTTTFYREGIEYQNRFVNVSEGVFSVYKPSTLSEDPDQVEVLKMRNINNRNEQDSIVAKMKAGIDASLILDIVKNRPDFMNIGNTDYHYLSSGMTTVDDRTVNIVSFEQNDYIDQPLYKGELYIDASNYALVGATFEVNPKYVKSATDVFVVKKSKGVKITPSKIVYSITYKRWQNHYYVDYVRGDLHFKVKKSRRWFGSSPLHTWFEMATCKIDTVAVKRFKKKNTLSRRAIFEDMSFPSDDQFWENFNVIPVDRKLNESIAKIAVKIEEILGTKTIDEK